MITEYKPFKWDIFIGIDVDKTNFAITSIDHSNKRNSIKMPADPQKLYQYINNRFDQRAVLCAYEAGPTGFDLYDQLKKRGQSCLVVAPASIPKAPNSKVKNNRIDSELISMHLKNGTLKSIRIPEGPYRELRELVKSRALYCRNQRSVKQRIKALLLHQHLYPQIKDDQQNWSNNYIKQLHTLVCSPAVRHRLNMLLNDLSYARKQLVIAQKTLKTFCKQHDEIQTNIGYLQSIDGIGFITAVNILGHIGNPQYLTNPRELAAFIGLVPREHSTGNAIKMGSITHCGNRQLRSLFIEAAWVAVRKNHELDKFFHRIKSRHHYKIASQKAIVAVARKLTGIVYAVLKNQRPFINR